MKPRVLFYVQHLLGIGHLVRSARIAHALERAGFDVDLVMGGMPVPGFETGSSTVQLAPVKAAPGFSALLDAEGNVLSEQAKDARRDELLAIFLKRQPDVLLLEAYPFGRRQMDFELLPLLERAQERSPPPLVAVSIRDILQRGRKPGRLAETAAIVERYVDLVLVHGDPTLVQLSQTFPLAERISDRIVYTGMVRPEPEDRSPASEHAVIVSAGGGAVGGRLIAAALAARPISSFRDAAWLIVAGPNLPVEAAEALNLQGLPGVTVSAFVPDLPRRLRSAVLSISQAGYNTAADLLAAGCACVLVPFAAGGETEQTDRARLLEARGLAIVIEEDRLEPRSLAAAMDHAAELPRRNHGIDLDGAAATARILAARVSLRQPGHHA